MKPMHIVLAALLLIPLAALRAADAPKPESPAAGAVVYTPHPHFRWEREADVKIEEVHRIQIARGQTFTDVVCDDRLEVVSRFVPVKPLSPSKYWWRVRRGDSEWSQAVGFEVRAPDKIFTIRAGSDAQAVTRVLLEAAASSGPARVAFEPGEYALAPKAGESLVTMTKARDLIIDGQGARLVLAGTFLTLNDCQRVTIQHFTITPARPGHTLVRVVKKDPAAMTLTVKPEPGYAADVLRLFPISRHCRQFPWLHGSSASRQVSRRCWRLGANTRIAPAKDEAGAFVFHPVKVETLDLMPIGAVAVVTAYRWHWVKTNAHGRMHVRRSHAFESALARFVPVAAMTPRKVFSDAK